MQKKILILSSNKSKIRDSKVFTDYIDKDRAAMYVVEVAALEELVYSFETDKGRNSIRTSSADISDFDLVWIKRSAGTSAPYAHVCALYLEDRGSKYICRDSFVTTSAEYNKLKEYAFFSMKGLPIPITLFINPTNADSVVNQVELSYPLVLKSATGSRGADNFLVENAEEIKRIVHEYDSDFILQEYISSDICYRFVVFGFKLRLAILKKNDDPTTHINTTAFGSGSYTVPLEDLPVELTQLSEHAATSMSREIAGIDVILDQYQKPYVLEVNRPPSIEGGELAHAKCTVLADYFDELLELNHA